MKSTSLKVDAMSQIRNTVFSENSTAVGLNMITMGVKPFTLTTHKEVIISRWCGKFASRVTPDDGL